ncbi:MAG: three-Cys-motif partner protein TcmP [Chloroflexi bacterium]|nr:three-Cys-motif partner protein TcmP [Chloroflexota bacterium]
MKNHRNGSNIVSKYFWAWAKVIISTIKRRSGDKIAYIDLFAGPGRYKDGTKSTPLLILEKAIQDPDMSQMLVTIFNDANADNMQSLGTAINQLPGIERLKYHPQVHTEEVGDRIVRMFEQMRLVPTLFFVDPWGYKGLSLRLVNSVIKDWGCDCIFFFNYNRINMGLNNPFVQEHMNALFGEARAGDLSQRLSSMRSSERELAIVEEIAQALKDMGGEYVLPFRFKNEAGNRTSHHLLFVSKAFKGYEIMKDIMANQSINASHGVASFEYSPATERQPLLFELSRPMDDLKESLLSDFAGQKLTMEQVYQKHNVGKPYIRRNYKEALKELEAKGRISASPSSDRRKKGTFADDVLVTFPLPQL